MVAHLKKSSICELGLSPGRVYGLPNCNRKWCLLWILVMTPSLMGSQSMLGTSSWLGSKQHSSSSVSSGSWGWLSSRAAGRLKSQTYIFKGHNDKLSIILIIRSSFVYFRITTTINKMTLFELQRLNKMLVTHRVSAFNKQYLEHSKDNFNRWRFFLFFLLTAEPEFGEEAEEQRHAVLVVWGGRVDGQAAGLQQAPDANHHHHFSQHAQGGSVTQETKAWTHCRALI